MRELFVKSAAGLITSETSDWRHRETLQLTFLHDTQCWRLENRLNQTMPRSQSESDLHHSFSDAGGDDIDYRCGSIITLL